MKDIKNEIRQCFITPTCEDDVKQIAANLNSWLEKAEEEMRYGDINDAITITLSIIEEIVRHSKSDCYSKYCKDSNPLCDCCNTANNIVSQILKNPSTRSDIKILLEYEAKKIN